VGIREQKRLNTTGLDFLRYEQPCNLGSNINRIRKLSPEFKQALGFTLLFMQWISATLTLELKRPNLEANYLQPPSAEVKNSWSCTSISLYVFMTKFLIKHTEKFIFF
jgi:hypothetical protein